MKYKNLFSHSKEELAKKRELNNIKYIHCLYEIMTFRYVSNDLTSSEAKQCAKNLYGIDLLNDSMIKDFMNNHKEIVMDYKYKKYSMIIFKLIDNFINEIIVSDKYKPVPLSEAVYKHLKQLILNFDTGKSALTKFLFEDKVLYDKKFMKKKLNIDDLDIQSIEFELLNIFGMGPFNCDVKRSTFLSTDDRNYLLMYRELINSYLSFDRLANQADFDRIRVCSMLVNILYHLFIPVELEIDTLLNMYNNNIKTHELYNKVIVDSKLEAEDLIDILLPNYLPVDFKEQLMITKSVLMCLKHQLHEAVL